MLSLCASAYYAAINLLSYYFPFYQKQIFSSSESCVKAWSSLGKFHAKDKCSLARNYLWNYKPMLLSRISPWYTAWPPIVRVSLQALLTLSLRTHTPLLPTAKTKSPFCGTHKPEVTQLSEAVCHRKFRSAGIKWQINYHWQPLPQGAKYKLP